MTAENHPRENENQDTRDMESDGSSPIFYLHSMMLLCGRLLGKILDAYNDIFSLSAPDKGKIYSNIVNHYVNKGRYTCALDYLHKWEKTAPGNKDVRYRTGVVLMTLARHTEALKAFAHVLHRDNFHKGALYRTCSILLKQKKYREAADLLEPVVAQAPPNARFYYLLAMALEGLGEIQKAAETMKIATELEPEEIKYHQHLGFLNVQMDDHKTAARSFTRVMEIERESEEL